MKILYVTTISNTVNAFLIPHIKMLVEQGHKVDIASNIHRKIDSDLLELGCKSYQIDFSRSPLNKSNLTAYKDLKNLIKSERYDLVHTHTPVASAIVRLACKNIKKTKVFYTAHGFHFYKGAPLKNWLIYYPLEKWLSKYTDTLITINHEDYERAKNKLKVKKVVYLPGVGLDIDKFKNTVVNRKSKRKDMGIPEDAFLVLSVGELNKNKNHQVIIKAISEINNPKIHYIICGKGSYGSYLEKLSIELGIEKNVHLLGLRKDIAEICKTSDMFAFPSFREGLSVALMEAMGAGLPVVCSNIRGNRDLVKEGKGGYLISPNSINGFVNSIRTLSKNGEERLAMSKYNQIYIKDFNINSIIKEQKKIYVDKDN